MKPVVTAKNTFGSKTAAFVYFLLQSLIFVVSRQTLQNSLLCLGFGRGVIFQITCFST